MNALTINLTAALEVADQIVADRVYQTERRRQASVLRAQRPADRRINSRARQTLPAARTMWTTWLARLAHWSAIFRPARLFDTSLETSRAIARHLVQMLLSPHPGRQRQGVTSAACRK